ncbi:MAG: potassium channel protein [Bacteroidia bacterium]
MGLLKGSQLRFKLYLALGLLLTSLFTGTLGFHYIEGFSIVESMYMTVITLSTVGFQEIHPLSDNGRLFTMFLIIGNLGIFTYTVSLITQLLVDGDLRKEYRRYMVHREIKRMKNHTIICGFGRNGQQACRELNAHHIPFVVVEKNEIDENFLDFKIQKVIGDARQDHILHEAGITKASALITTLPDDAANVFVVITARHICPNLTIISRATDDSAEDKLRRAGADHVIMPDKVGGAHMASLVSKPDVMEFIDLITGQRSNEFQVAEFNIDLVNEKFHKLTIAELDIRGKTGANIIGFKTNSNEYVINPQANQRMEEHCKLIVLGTKEQINNLEKYYYT